MTQRPALPKPALPPGTILRAPKALVSNGKEIVGAGEVFCVGPYSEQDGLAFLWLFSAAGELTTTADRDWVDEHLEIVRLGTSKDWYLFPSPWPPTIDA